MSDMPSNRAQNFEKSWACRVWHQYPGPVWNCAVALFCFAICIASGCHSNHEGNCRVRLFAAASLTGVCQKIAESEDDLVFSIDVALGPSNALSQQILSGANADVFISANPLWTEELAKTGLIERQVDLLTNRLVLIVPIDNPASIESLNDLDSDRVRRIAIAGKNVPAGMYADEALAAAQLSDKIEPKLVRGNDVRSVLMYAEQAEVDAALVYESDLVGRDRVKKVTRISGHTPIIYSMVLLKDHSPDGEKLFKFLQSDMQKQQFEAFGFRVQ